MGKRPIHVHKYGKVEMRKDKSYVIFRCFRPGCTHYLRDDLALGQASLCWRCGKEFVMSKADLTRRKPHCVECTRAKKKGVESLGDVASHLDDLLKGLGVPD